MLYVGLTTSLSLVINVLIILHSLADSLALILTVNLPVYYDLGVIATLDTGTNIDQPKHIVKSYALTWWEGTCRPAEGGLLDVTTLQVFSTITGIDYFKPC